MVSTEDFDSEGIGSIPIWAVINFTEGEYKNMSNLKSPCKDCQLRKVGCHSTCSDYIKYSKLCEEQAEIRRKAKRKSNLYRATPSAKVYCHSSKLLEQSAHKRRD